MAKVTKPSPRRNKIILAIIIGIFAVPTLALAYTYLRPKVSFPSENGEGYVTGTVTRKFTDCSGGEEMNQLGAISPIKEVTCDGGSEITLNFIQTFRTSSGEGGPPYTVDVKDIRVGDKVRVNFTQDTEGNTTLNCKGCSVQKLP